MTDTKNPDAGRQTALSWLRKWACPDELKSDGDWLSAVDYILPHKMPAEIYNAIESALAHSQPPEGLDLDWEATEKAVEYWGRQDDKDIEFPPGVSALYFFARRILQHRAKPPEQGQVAAVSEALDILDRVIKSRELRGVFLDEVYKAAALLKSELARGKGGV